MRASASMMLGGTLVLGGFRADHAAPGTHRRARALPEHRAVDPLGRRRLHDHLRPCSPSACSGGAPCRAFGSLETLFSTEKTERSIRGNGRHRSADFVVHSRASSSRLIGLAWMAQATFDMPYWQSTARRADDVCPGAGGLPGDRRNRHHADRRHGQGHATDLRRCSARGNMNVNLMSANITAAQPRPPPIC